MKNILVLIFISLSLMSSNAQNLKLKLWPDGVPGAVPNANYKEAVVSPWGTNCWEKISEPELQVFLPDSAKANGCAVVVCPGGGYCFVSFVNEGLEIAKWLNSNGITAIILKYRLPSDLIMKDKTVGPLQDAQEAVRVVRRNAKTWNIHPEKIGIMGFSAGGHLAASLSTHYTAKVYETKDKVSARPNFSLLIYPVISLKTGITHQGSREALLGKKASEKQIAYYSNELQIDKNTPPAFLVHSADDTVVPVENSLLYFGGLQAKKVKSELHIYQKGGHGYGLGKSSTENAWPAACIQWLQANAWL